MEIWRKRPRLCLHFTLLFKVYVACDGSSLNYSQILGEGFAKPPHSMRFSIKSVIFS